MNGIQIAVVSILPFIITLLTALLVKKTQILDMPNQWKNHGKTMPSSGGLPIFLGWSVGMTALAIINSKFFSQIFFVYMVTLTVAVVLGFIDDLRKMSLGVKIAGYFGVGASAGITYVIFGGSFLPAVYLCLLVVICQSAVNSIDGLDGLASGITVVFGVGAVVPAMFTGNSYLLLIVGVMISTLGAFLKYESYPAEIYLGSAGRLMLGAFLAVTGFYTFKHFSMFQSLMGVLILVGIPIFNVLVTFTRQIINSKPVFAPGRSQFYNILMDQKGFGHMEAVMACYLLQLVCALLAVIYYLTAANWRLLIFIIILVNTVVFTIFHKLLVADTTSDLSLHN